MCIRDSNDLLVQLGDAATQSTSLNVYAEMIGTQDASNFVAGIAGDAKRVDDFLQRDELKSLLAVSKVESATARNMYRLLPMANSGVKPMIIATTKDTIWVASGKQSRELLEAKLKAARGGTAADMVDIQFRAIPLLESLSLSNRLRKWSNYKEDDVRLRTSTLRKQNAHGANPITLSRTQITLGSGVTRIIGEWLGEFSRDNLDL